MYGPKKRFSFRDVFLLPVSSVVPSSRANAACFAASLFRYFILQIALGSMSMDASENEHRHMK